MILPSSEALALCTINALSEEELGAMSSWLVMGMTSHPAMAESIAVVPASRDAANEAAAGVFSAIWGERCAAEREAAVQEGGEDAVANGQMLVNAHLMNWMMTSPEVHESLLGVNAYLQ